MKINSFVWWGGDIYQVYANHCNTIFIGKPFTYAIAHTEAT